MFIPLILWRRKQKLIKNIKEAQKQDINLRYQVRLGSKDIELWTKHVGENYFQKTPLFAFGDLPDIEKKEFSPIKERDFQSSDRKRDRSESPEMPSKKGRASNYDQVFNNCDTKKDEEFLVTAAEQSENIVIQ